LDERTRGPRNLETTVSQTAVRDCRRRTPPHEAGVPPERLFVKAVGFRPTAPRGKSLRIQISRHGWHAFRRGIATNLHQLGVADKDIQGILRHSNIGITMNIYVKSVAESQVDTMDLLGKNLRNNRLKILLSRNCE
jgi:integrase